MKPNLLTTLQLLLATSSSFGQGVFLFSNNGGNLGARTPVYGPEPGNRSLQLWGNPPDADPPGTQIYTGAPLVGTNYSVEAWYTLDPVDDMFQLVTDARPVQGSLTTFRFPSVPGIFQGGYRVVPDPNPPSTPGFPFYVYMQVRAWDNANGQYPTWVDAWNGANHGSGRAVGWSTVFYQPVGSESSTLPWPGLINFESFNLFYVPEPTTASLALLAGALWLLHRRPRDQAGLSARASGRRA